MFAAFECDRITALRGLCAIAAALWRDGWYFASKHCDTACLCWAVMWKQVSEIKQNCRRESKTPLCCGCKQKAVLLDVHWDRREPTGLFLVASIQLVSQSFWEELDVSPGWPDVAQLQLSLAAEKLPLLGESSRTWSNISEVWLAEAKHLHYLLTNDHTFISFQSSLVDWLLLWPEFLLKFVLHSNFPKLWWNPNKANKHKVNSNFRLVKCYTKQKTWLTPWSHYRNTYLTFLQEFLSLWLSVSCWMPLTSAPHIEKSVSRQTKSCLPRSTFFKYMIRVHRFLNVFLLSTNSNARL